VVKRASKAKRGAPKPMGFGMPDLPQELIEQLLEALTKGGGPMPLAEESAADELEAAFQDFLDLDDPRNRTKKPTRSFPIWRTGWISFGSTRTAATRARATL